LNDSKQTLPPELQQAVALYYDGSGTPQITAKGVGKQAEEIIALATESGIPMCDNAALVEILSKIELGEQIPEALYLSVAHVIAFAYHLKGLDQREPNPLSL